MDITRKPSEEQLAQALEAIPRIEPDNNDLSSLSLNFELHVHSLQPVFPLIWKLYLSE